MRIDLHTHSDASDGTDEPAELVRKARQVAGLDVVALTDHDTAAGWDEAVSAAHDVGIILVRGMELSTKHRGRGIHLLAYLPDPTYPPLADRLARIIGGRGTRIPAMLEQLAEAGYPLSAHDVRGPATGPVGRPHVADAMVRAGYAVDRTAAFHDFLGYGKVGYVDRYAPSLIDMIAVVKDAGGVTVIAHPWGRHGPDGLDRDDLGSFVDAGLTGLEVDHHDHDVDARAALTAMAAEHDLVVTGSSDYHGLGKVDHDLGSCTTAPEMYERLLDAAAAASRASGRATPEVLVP